MVGPRRPVARGGGCPVPVLPLIDLMILIAWTSLIVGAVQKLTQIALATRAAIFGLGPYDFVVIAGVSLLFALSLAARVWVKAYEPGLLRQQRARRNGFDEVLPDFPDPRERLADEPERTSARDQVAAG